MAAARPGSRERQAANVVSCSGSDYVVRTMWSREIGGMVRKAMELPETPHNVPLGALARLVRGLGPAGPALVPSTTTSYTNAGGRREPLRAGALPNPWSGSENSSKDGCKHNLLGDRGREFYPDHSAHISGPCKRRGKRRGEAEGGGKGMGEKRQSSSRESDASISERGGGGEGGEGSAGTSESGSSKRRKLRHSSASGSSTGAPIVRAQGFIWSDSECWTDVAPDDPGTVADALTYAEGGGENAARDKTRAAGSPHLSAHSVSGKYRTLGSPWRWSLATVEWGLSTRSVLATLLVPTHHNPVTYAIAAIATYLTVHYLYLLHKLIHPILRRYVCIPGTV